MPASPYQQLEAEFHRLYVLRAAAGVLRWDAATMLPKGSVDTRGEQLAVLDTECHAMLTAPKISRLLERAAANASGLDERQQANLRLMRREYDHAIAVPKSLVSRLAKATSSAEMRWREARQKSDFNLFAPHLDEVLKLSRDKAQLLGQALKLEPYDALVDGFSPGLTMQSIDRIFTPLAQRLPALIDDAIQRQTSHEVLPLSAKVSSSKQRALAQELMQTLGFAFDRGRLDESEHPFTGGSHGDIRITTRFKSQDVLSGLMAVVHETGHALYGQGLPKEWCYQPVGQDAGMAVHESQSLLLEMFIGRSRAFVNYLTPMLSKAVGVDDPAWQPDNVYRALNKVARSLIRVDADEMTYPAHIMLRYDLERQLLSGELAVKDLPEAWNEDMDSRLGVRPGNDAEGCLQDIHWAFGAFGYFPSYAIGAVIAAQMMEHVRIELPTLDAEIEQGQFKSLFTWLGEQVHARGAVCDTLQLVEQATGRPLNASAWLRHVESKYLV
jgi:carboxypeptidase Taq